ncbi:MAG TPA: peroxiredoxin [Gemmatimonadales bacterium]|nr:peroxiredoxin [Gemmatimonadales bacterium]
MAVGIGALAPDFTLSDASGKPFRLAELRGRKAVVLYFYPKDETLGCTAEACAFRDSYEVFTKAGAEVVGVSADSPAAHHAFAAHHHLPFVLLSDPDNLARRLYGVRKSLGILPGRVTYVIDREGIVRHVFDSQLQATRHVVEALRSLETK